MKTLIVYSSKTGNTKKVAEAILSVMPEDTACFPVEDAPTADEYDFIAIGFWVNRGTADKNAQEYMSTIKRKKVALFGTLGAEPESDHAKKSMENAKKLVSQDNQIVGEFMCQGKIEPRLTEAFAKRAAGSHHVMTPERAARHERAKTHPDAQDLSNAREVFQNILRTLINT